MYRARSRPGPHVTRILEGTRGLGETVFLRNRGAHPMTQYTAGLIDGGPSNHEIADSSRCR